MVGGVCKRQHIYELLWLNSITRKNYFPRLLAPAHSLHSLTSAPIHSLTWNSFAGIIARWWAKQKSKYTFASQLRSGSLFTISNSFFSPSSVHCQMGNSIERFDKILKYNLFYAARFLAIQMENSAAQFPMAKVKYSTGQNIYLAKRLHLPRRNIGHYNTTILVTVFH